MSDAGLKINCANDFDAEWNSLVAQARERVKAIQRARMEIADLAIRACTIVHGGGLHWTNHAHVTTLKKFAFEIHVSYKTLHTWVSVKRNVVEKLKPGSYDDRNYRAAHETLERLPVPKKDNSPHLVQRTYDDEKTRKEDRHYIMQATKQLKLILYRFEQKQIDLSKCSKEEQNEFAFTLGKIKKHLKAQGFGDLWV